MPYTHFSLLEWTLDFDRNEFWVTVGGLSGYLNVGTALFHLGVMEGTIWWDFLWVNGIRRLFRNG